MTCCDRDHEHARPVVDPDFDDRLRRGRAWHGIARDYMRGAERASSLRELVRTIEHPTSVTHPTGLVACDDPEASTAWGEIDDPDAMISDRLELDRAGVLAAWGEVDDPDATVVAGIRREPALAIERVELRAWKWIEVFERAVAQLALQSTDPVVALGGGCDAAAVLVAWHASGLPMPHACTLAVGLDGYDEVETALAIAEQLHVDCEVIEIDPATLVELAPEAAAIAGTPLYNLHPVHRLALARALPGATLVTGDGADAVFAGVPDLDYVPIVAALSEPVSPFFDAAVVEGAPRDPAKQLLRDYLEVHGLGWLAERPKQPRLVPPLELEPILDRERIARLARALELEPRLDEDRRRVGWATLDHLVRSLERS